MKSGHYILQYTGIDEELEVLWASELQHMLAKLQELQEDHYTSEITATITYQDYYGNLHEVLYYHPKTGITFSTTRINFSQF